MQERAECVQMMQGLILILLIKKLTTLSKDKEMEPDREGFVFTLLVQLTTIVFSDREVKSVNLIEYLL